MDGCSGKEEKFMLPAGSESQSHS